MSKKMSKDELENLAYELSDGIMGAVHILAIVQMQPEAQTLLEAIRDSGLRGSELYSTYVDNGGTMERFISIIAMMALSARLEKEMGWKK